MKVIDANTKISYLIKAHPDALEAIASIDPKLQKLRNPFLRKALAGRTSIAMASKITGHTVQEFFDKLRPLGFPIDSDRAAEVETVQEKPAYLRTLAKENIRDFDVRELLATGQDPLTMILDKVNALVPGEALKVINTFSPVPLIKMLEKKGFEVYADTLGDELVETYFYKASGNADLGVESIKDTAYSWEEVQARFTDKVVEIDVRELEMPLPMHTILGELEDLPQDAALLVHHKRIPVFLLPELEDRQFDYRIQEIGDGQVQLLIFRP